VHFFESVGAFLKNVGAFLKNVGALLQMYQQKYVVSSGRKWRSVAKVSGWKIKKYLIYERVVAVGCVRKTKK